MYLSLLSLSRCLSLFLSAYASLPLSLSLRLSLWTHASLHLSPSLPLSLRLNQQQKSELGSQVEELQKALQDLGSKTEDVSGSDLSN